MVFVVDLDNRVAVRKVILGPVSEGRAVVESGLEAGEKVVVDETREELLKKIITYKRAIFQRSEALSWT